MHTAITQFTSRRSHRGRSRRRKNPGHVSHAAASSSKNDGQSIPKWTMPAHRGSRKNAAAARESAVKTRRTVLPMSVLPDVGGDALHDHVKSHQIVPALQHDDVRELAGRLHKLLVHGLHGGQILVHHRFQ